MGIVKNSHVVLLYNSLKCNNLKSQKIESYLCYSTLRAFIGSISNRFRVILEPTSRDNANKTFVSMAAFTTITTNERSKKSHSIFAYMQFLLYLCSRFYYA